MYKVLIIDDEAMIRAGLRDSIPWEAISCRVVEVADNGVDALHAIDRCRPDIIVTDIKMPGCTGIEVADHAIKANPLVKVILLSGYNDFEYAQKAIHLGVYHYMLKPTNYEEMKRVIADAIRDIQAEERRSLELAKFRSEFQQQLHLYRGVFLRKMILSGQLESSAPAPDDLCRLYEIPAAGSYFLILFKPDEIESRFEREEEKQYWMLTIADSVDQYAQSKNGCYSVPLKDEWFGIVFVTDEAESKRTITEHCEQIQSLLASKDMPLTLSFSVSRQKPSLFQLNQAYFEAVDAMQHIFYLGFGSIIFYDDITQTNDKDDERLPFSYYTECGKQIIKALQVGDEENSRQLLSGLYESFSRTQESPGVVRAVSVEIAAQIVSFAMRSNMDHNLGHWGKLYNDILHCETSDGYYKIMETTIATMSREIFRKTRNQHKKVIEQIIGLLKQFYPENISLEWLSGQIHLNSNYLSRLIKKETGETFSELLTNIRIEQAKKLLQNPTSKIYEISSQIGFDDAHYFSAKFKKVTGVSPTEYRDQYSEVF